MCLSRIKCVLSPCEARFLSYTKACAAKTESIVYFTRPGSLVRWNVLLTVLEGRLLVCGGRCLCVIDKARSIESDHCELHICEVGS